MSKHIPPVKSIRKFCLQCAGGPKEVRFCQITGCQLYIYRMGKNPARKGIGPGMLPLAEKNAVESPKITKKEVLNEGICHLQDPKFV